MGGPLVLKVEALQIVVMRFENWGFLLKYLNQAIVYREILLKDGGGLEYFVVLEEEIGGGLLLVDVFKFQSELF